MPIGMNRRLIEESRDKVTFNEISAKFEKQEYIKLVMGFNEKCMWADIKGDINEIELSIDDAMKLSEYCMSMMYFYLAELGKDTKPVCVPATIISMRDRYIEALKDKKDSIRFSVSIVKGVLDHILYLTSNSGGVNNGQNRIREERSERESSIGEAQLGGAQSTENGSEEAKEISCESGVVDNNEVSV